MRSLRRLFIAAAVALAVGSIHASGPLGIYGIIERVVFEPNETSPDRVQVWGAFTYVDGGTERALGTSDAKRGFLYFRLPPADAGETQLTAVRTEWRDLKSVAGTGQAVGFGSWGYIGAFSGLTPDARTASPPYILEMRPGGGDLTDMRVRPASETPANPAVYRTNTGVVKLTETGNQAAIVKKLRDALGK